MRRRQALHAIVAAAAFAAGRLQAQALRKPAVVGLLDAGERLEWWDAFRQQMRELGYAEGRDVRYEARYAKGRLDALDGLARELVQLKVAVIVTSGSAASVAARKISRSVPIVAASGGDQVSLGLAATLARPGGTVTGVVSFSTDLMVKRFEILRELVPRGARMGVL